MRNNNNKKKRRKNLNKNCDKLQLTVRHERKQGCEKLSDVPIFRIGSGNKIMNRPNRNASQLATLACQREQKNAEREKGASFVDNREFIPCSACHYFQIVSTFSPFFYVFLAVHALVRSNLKWMRRLLFVRFFHSTIFIFKVWTVSWKKNYLFHFQNA